MNLLWLGEHICFPKAVYTREFVPRLDVKELIPEVCSAYLSVFNRVASCLYFRLLGKETSLKINLPSFLLDFLLKKRLKQKL